MARFRFRLETLLRLRAMLRDQRRAELAQAYRAAELLAEQQEQIQKRHELLIEQQARAVGPGPINVDRLLDYRRHSAILLAQIRDLEQKRKLVEQEIESRRAALVNADREVRILEKLKERRQQLHQYEEEQKQLKQLDEIAQIMYRRETH